MKGRDPLHAIQLIHDLKLYSSIFWASPTALKSFSSRPADSLQGLTAATILHSLTTTPSPLPAIHPLLAQHFTLHPSTRPRLFLASALTPFKGITYPDTKNKIHPAIEAILRDGCKLGNQNNYLSGIPTLFSATELLKNPTLEGDRFKERPERVAIGWSLIRCCASHIFTNAAQAYSSATSSYTTRMWGQPGPSLSCSLWYKNYSRFGRPRTIMTVRGRVPFHMISADETTAAEVAERIETYNRFISHVEELDLVGVGDARTILTVLTRSPLGPVPNRTESINREKT